MSATTSYGTWQQHADSSHSSLRGEVEAALGEHVGTFDVDAIERDYRAAIAERLPPDVTLSGDEFSGPYPEPDSAADDIHDALLALHGEPFWEIVQRHARRPRKIYLNPESHMPCSHRIEADPLMRCGESNAARVVIAEDSDIVAQNQRGRTYTYLCVTHGGHLLPQAEPWPQEREGLVP
jgi:hypothetical protein